MIIAAQKRKENIAEYLLYMWQVEDLIRANGLDIDRIKANVIDRFDLTPDARKEMVDWYEGLIDMMRREGVEIVSCPTCGRTKVDLIALAQRVERAVASVQAPITVAIMGCAVNGPGEAREADIGLAGGDGELLLFKRGRPVKKVPESDAVDILLREIESLAAGAANE